LVAPLLPPDVLAAIAREHLAGVHDAHVAPDIPPRKLRGAREAHALALPPGEPIVVLYDSTLLGGGEDGFVATPARLCWKNHYAAPRSALWDELARVALEQRGTSIGLGRGALTAPVTSRAAERVLAFLQACCLRTAPASRPYRDLARPRDPSTFAALVVSAARGALGELEWVHYAPSIPPRMKKALRVVHERHLHPRDEILVLYDDTVFGSGTDGFLLTERGVHWHNFWGPADALAWIDMDPDRVVTDGDLLFVEGEPARDNERHLDLRMRPGMARLVADALREIARAARVGLPGLQTARPR
jgi:hypothetical protein